MGALASALAQAAGSLGPGCAKVDAKPEKYACGCSLSFAQDPEEKVLRGNLLVAVHVGFSPGEVENLGRSGGQRQLSLRSIRARTDKFPDQGADRIRIDSGNEDACSIARALANESQENVLGAEMVVIHGDGLDVSKVESGAGGCRQACFWHRWLRTHVSRMPSRQPCARSSA